MLNHAVVISFVVEEGMLLTILLMVHAECPNIMCMMFVTWTLQGLQKLVEQVWDRAVTITQQSSIWKWPRSHSPGTFKRACFGCPSYSCYFPRYPSFFLYTYTIFTGWVVYHIADTLGVVYHHYPIVMLGRNLHCCNIFMRLTDWATYFRGMKIVANLQK